MRVIQELCERRTNGARFSREKREKRNPTVIQRHRPPTDALLHPAALYEPASRVGFERAENRAPTACRRYKVGARARERERDTRYRQFPP